MVDWGSGIKVVRKTSSDLTKTESLVVLECVDRLLNKGYSPDSIVLEKDWSKQLKKSKEYVHRMSLLDGLFQGKNDREEESGIFSFL